MTEAEHPEPGQITSKSTILRAGIRELIQEHFEGFNPHRSRLPRWRRDEGTASALLKRRRKALDKALLELSDDDGDIVETKS